MLSALLRNIIHDSTSFLPFENYGKVISSILLIREHHDFHSYYIQYKPCKSRFADTPFTVNLLPVKNKKIGSFSKAIIQ